MKLRWPPAQPASITVAGGGGRRLMMWLPRLIDELLNAYTWVVIASAIVSWLVAFGVVLLVSYVPGAILK